MDHRYYRPELDVLRFLAFFLVFLSHVVPGDVAFFAQMGLPSAIAHSIIDLAAGGAFGVDLFFALSAFLITTLLLRERNACGTIDVQSFYFRRMLRIWPLYFVFLLAVRPLLGHLLPDDDMPLKYSLAFILLAGNWACVLWGYPHTVASPLWSVSIEEQFYLAWPLIMRRSAHVLRVAWVLLGIAFISRCWLVLQGAVHPQIWCNTLARLDPIAAGAIVAVYVERKPLSLSSVSCLLLFLSGVTILGVAGGYGDFVGVKALVTFPAVTVGCIALLIATVATACSQLERPALASQPIQTSIRCVLTYLGKISYGLYVFHPMFVAIFQVGSAHTPIARLTRIAGALAATLATAAASYQWFERRFLRVKEGLARVKSRPV